MFSFVPQPRSRSSRQTRPHPFMQPPRQLKNQQRNSSKSNLLAMIQTPEGNLDLEKIAGTVQKIGSVYGKVSPMISKFIKK